MQKLFLERCLWLLGSSLYQLRLVIISDKNPIWTSSCTGEFIRWWNHKIEWSVWDIWMTGAHLPVTATQGVPGSFSFLGRLHVVWWLHFPPPQKDFSAWSLGHQYHPRSYLGASARRERWVLLSRVWQSWGQGLPWCPLDKNLLCKAGDEGLIPGQRTEISHATTKTHVLQLRPDNKEIFFMQSNRK